MYLYMMEVIHREHLTTDYFFRMAHVWKFGRTANVYTDVQQLEHFGIVPQYVQDYVHHLQDVENGFPGYEVFQQ